MKKLLILTLLFTGCYSAKKAAEQVKKANDNYPEVVAKTARDLYPCIPLKAKTDSADYNRWKNEADSLKYLYEQSKSKVPDIVEVFTDTTDCVAKCNEQLNNFKKTIWLKDDYILKLENKIRNTKAIRDTIPIEDSAKIKLMAISYAETVKLFAIQVNNLQQDTTALKSNIIKLQGKVSAKNKELWIWRILALIVVVYFGFKLRKKLLR